MPTSESPTHDEYAENIPLMGDEDIDEQPTTPQPRTSVKSCHSDARLGSPWYLSALVSSAFLFSVISLFWSGAQLHSYTRRFNSPGLEVSTLRHPSLYIGLDRVPAIRIKENGSSTSMTSGPSPTHTPLYPGGPQQVVRVNSDYPYTTYPEDRWVLLSKKDLVLMKFQPPVDWSGCEVSNFFPKRSELGNKMLTLEGERTQIQVRFLPSLSVINSTTWNSRPPVDRILGHLEAMFGRSDSTASFRCAHDTPVMVELSCVGDGCRVEYKEDAGQLPILGLLLPHITSRYVLLIGPK